jgi:hypothetical protein
MTQFESDTGWTGYYYYKVYANVVYFPIKELKSQERRLKAFRGKRVPRYNPTDAGYPIFTPSEFNKAPPTGCS